MTLASAARAYSERLAWAVLPLRGKVPAIPKGRGYLDATTDPATISRWWREYPDANVGVSCIGSNLVVLDVDPRHGGDRTLAELEERHGKLPPTIRQVTGSGGQHILFHPVGDLPPGSLGKGIDVKWRGYIVTAPSVHPDTGRHYAWLPDLHPLVRPSRDAGMARRAAFTPSTAACRAPTSGYEEESVGWGPCPAYSRAALLSAYENIAGAEAAAETLKKCLPRAFVETFPGAPTAGSSMRTSAPAGRSSKAPRPPSSRRNPADDARAPDPVRRASARTELACHSGPR